MAAKKRKSGVENLDTAMLVIDGLVKLGPVLAQLATAPKPALEWAAKMRAERTTGSRLSSLTDRVGQKGLERRVAAVRTGVELALPAEDSVGRGQLLAQVDRLDGALRVAASLPLVKRKQAHSRIDDELDVLERGLVDAMLPTN